MKAIEAIDKYSKLVEQETLVRQMLQDELQSLISQEIKDRMEELKAEFEPRIEQLSEEKSALESEIKSEVLEAGRTVKGTYHSFVWSKPRVSWDTKALDGYAAAHPEIAQFRTEGSPSVSVRKQ